MAFLNPLKVPTNDVNEAIKESGINWNVRADLVKFQTPNGDYRNFEGKYVLFKDSNDHTPLGVVGNKYQIFQNREMWDFIDDFIKNGCSDCKIDAVSELRNGSRVIVSIRSREKEFVNNDGIYEYFIFKNSFDGSSPLQVFFTNIRIVCSNTLISAIKKAKMDKVFYNIMHTKSMNDKLKTISTIVAKNREVQNEFDEAMKYLASKQLTKRKTIKVLTSAIFPKTTEGKRGKSIRKAKINKVLELADMGMGTSIPGVQGTAYGLYQAFTEWVDHHKTVRVPKGQKKDEIRFESNMFTTGAKLKAEALDKMLRYNY